MTQLEEHSETIPRPARVLVEADQLWYLSAFLSHPLSGGYEHYENCTLGIFILMDLKFGVMNVFWRQPLSFFSSFLPPSFPSFPFFFPPSVPLPTSLNSINPTYGIQSVLLIYGFHIHRFNPSWIKNIQKKVTLLLMYYVGLQ